MIRWTVPANIPVPAFGGSSLFGTFTQSIGENLARFPQGPPLQDKFWYGRRRTPSVYCSLLPNVPLSSCISLRLSALWTSLNSRVCDANDFVPFVGCSSSRTTSAFLQLCFLARWGLPAMCAMPSLVSDLCILQTLDMQLVLSHVRGMFADPGTSRARAIEI